MASETVRRLVLASYESAPNASGCISQQVRTENLMWFPTSQQMATIWGLKLDTSICNDDPQCIRRTLGARLRSGTTVVLGNDVYVIP